AFVEHGVGQGGQAGHVVVAAAGGEGQAQVEHRQLARLDEQHAGAFGGLPVLNVEGALGRCLAVEGGQRLQAGGWRGNLRQRRGLGVAAGDIGEQADQQDQAKAEQAVTDALALAHGWTPSTAFSGRIWATARREGVKKVCAACWISAGVTASRAARSWSISVQDRPTVSSAPMVVAWLVIESRS